VITVQDLALWTERLPPSAGRTAVIAVDGPSGSGKSTLAAALGTATGAPVVRMDDLYPGWDGLEDAVPRVVEWILQPLAHGGAARFRRYDWVENRYAEWHDVPGHRLLIIEGVASGSRACAPHLAGVIWAEAGRDERFRRGIARDGEAYLPHWERWAVQEEAHFAAESTRRRADIVLATDAAPEGFAVGAAWTAVRLPEAVIPPGSPGTFGTFGS
jgi:uridine kinase